jgi:hypothetical protein
VNTAGVEDVSHGEWIRLGRGYPPDVVDSSRGKAIDKYRMIYAE